MRFTEYQRSWELLLGDYEVAKKTIRSLEISAYTLRTFLPVQPIPADCKRKLRELLMKRLFLAVLAPELFSLVKGLSGTVLAALGTERTYKLASRNFKIFDI